MNDYPSEQVRIIIEDENLTMRRCLRQLIKDRRLVQQRYDLIRMQVAMSAANRLRIDGNDVLRRRLDICSADLVAYNRRIDKFIATLAQNCSHRLVVEKANLHDTHDGQCSYKERCCVWCLLHETSLGTNHVFLRLATAADRLAIIVPASDFDQLPDRISNMGELITEQLIAANFQLLKS